MIPQTSSRMLTNEQTQVVGMPDPVVGEVPVAVVKSSVVNSARSKLKSDLRDRVTTELGTAFALGDVFTLTELGLSDFPLTSSGKVYKANLKERLSEHLRSIEEISRHQKEGSMLGHVTHIWSRGIWFTPEKIAP